MIRYFCCRLTPSGIGDQLSQLNRLHDLGRRWGLEYLYRDFPRNRWSPDFDAADFLGLGLGEQRVEDHPDHALVSVDGAAALRALQEGRPLESLLPGRAPPRAIMELVHSSTMYSLGAPVQLQYPINLREKLLQRHGAQILQRGPKDRLSVCVHVRQGDCTWVRRGDRYVFLGMRKIASDPQDVDLRRAPHAEDYVPVLDDMAACLRERPWSLTAFSDGPANIFPQPSNLRGRLLYRLALQEPRLIDWLRLTRSRHPLHGFYNPMCDDTVVRAYEHARDAVHRLVARYPDARLVVGTSRALTEEAIIEFATADVAVLARSHMAFPLLGLGDPQKQAVLLLTKDKVENQSSLEQLLSRLGPLHPMTPVS